MATTRPRPSCIAATLAVCLCAMTALALQPAAAAAHHRRTLAVVLTDDNPAGEQLIPGQPPAWVPIDPSPPTPGTSLLPAILTASGPLHGVVVTPSQAEQIVAAVWTLRNAAFTTSDRALMAEFETGPAFESDEVTCGCNERLPRGPIGSESVFVPRQTSYPAVFMAEVATTFESNPYLQFLVMGKASAHAPWLVTSDPGDETNAPLLLPKVDGAGFDVVRPPPAAAARRLPARLAAYWEGWTDTGHAPRGISFAPGTYTTENGETLAAQPQGSVDPDNGLQSWSNYRAGHDTWSFGTTTGGVTCGVVWAQFIWSSPYGVYQNPQQNQWGPTVKPGVYRMDVQTDIIQPCFEEQRTQPPVVVSGQLDPDTEEGVTAIPLVPGTQA